MASFNVKWACLALMLVMAVALTGTQAAKSEDKPEPVNTQSRHYDNDYYHKEDHHGDYYKKACRCKGAYLTVMQS